MSHDAFCVSPFLAILYTSTIYRIFLACIFIIIGVQYTKFSYHDIGAICIYHDDMIYITIWICGLKLS